MTLVMKEESFTVRKWKVTTDIVELSAECGGEMLTIINQRYREIDVQKTMRELMECTNLLRVALTASSMSTASPMILKMVSQYQNLVGNAEIANTRFVTACLKALQMHSLALQAMDKDKPAIALKAFYKCAEQAGLMEGICTELTMETAQLLTTAEDALVASAKDQVQAKQLKDQIDAERRKAMEDQAELAQKLQELPIMLAKQKEELHAANHAADGHDAGTAALISGATLSGLVGIACPPVAVVGLIAAGVGCHFNQKAKKEKSEKALVAAQAATAEINKIQQQEMGAKAEMAKNLVQLRHNVETGNENERSMKCLVMTKQILGQLKNRFENVRLFWHHVQLHCKMLADKDEVEIVSELGDTDALKDCFFESAKSWASLGKVSYDACEALVAARASVADVMENLPSGSEHPRMISDMCDKLEMSIKIGMEELQAEAQAIEDMP